MLPDNSVDAIVCDRLWTPLHGEKWDYDVPGVEIWVECFARSQAWRLPSGVRRYRTQHRMAVRIEDAGFEIRDMMLGFTVAGYRNIKTV